MVKVSQRSFETQAIMIQNMNEDLKKDFDEKKKTASKAYQDANLQLVQFLSIMYDEKHR